jgi:hypothetical protein
MKKILLILIVLPLYFITSCEDNVHGCLDSQAINYNPEATLDNNSCEYYVDGCMDSLAINYNSEATFDDNSCEYYVEGCMDSLAINYNSEATLDNNSCEYIEGCTDNQAVNYNPEAIIDDESCLFDTDGDGIYDEDEIYGCQDFTACNYNSDVTENDESCEYPYLGYDCEGNITEHLIGMEIEGGILFYIDDTGEHGLVAAMEDLEGAYGWGCSGTSIDGADGQAIGTGYQNTLDIVAGCSETSTSAYQSLNATTEGYTDWFLPSTDELLEMYTTIGQGSGIGNIGGFQDTWYWSSSESSNDSAWLVYFYNGVLYNYDAGSTDRVRIIRSF